MTAPDLDALVRDRERAWGGQEVLALVEAYREQQAQLERYHVAAMAISGALVDHPDRVPVPKDDLFILWRAVEVLRGGEPHSSVEEMRRANLACGAAMVSRTEITDDVDEAVRVLEEK